MSSLRRKGEVIKPENVTKPIQLLAAWLVGLLATLASFLTAARFITSPAWASGALVLAAMASVPIFLFCIFLLQTRFRPEMQEDSYYSQHLERKFSQQSQKMQLVTTRPKLGELRILERSTVTMGDVSAPRNRAIDHDLSQFIAINDLLDRYTEIVAALREDGLVAAETFGSSSRKLKKPENFVISVGADVPVPLARFVIRKVSEFGLQGLGVGDTDTDRERIYIGAYSYDDEGRSFLKASTRDFDKVMNDFTPEETFFGLIRRYEYSDDDE